jgi:hypothetical protein
MSNLEQTIEELRRRVESLEAEKPQSTRISPGRRLSQA